MSGTKAGTVRRYDIRQRRPVSDWKLAKEGGIGCVVPASQQCVSTYISNLLLLISVFRSELFFADRSSLVGALDLRTGRLLYTYSSMTCTAHHLLPIPPRESGSSKLGLLASISSDATMRLHSTVPPLVKRVKGNQIGQGVKPKVVNMVGGVGVGSFAWRGWGEVAGTARQDRVGGVEVENEEQEDGEEVWEGMSEVEDETSDAGSIDAPSKRRKT